MIPSVMRRVSTLGTVTLGVLLLLAPAGQACLAFQQMAETCPMPKAAAMPDQHATGLEHAAPAMAQGVAAGGHEHEAAATAPAARCHEGQEPAAACCRAGTAPGQVEGTSFGSPKLPALLAAASGTAAIRDLAPEDAMPELGSWARPPEPSRYELFSSYLL